MLQEKPPPSKAVPFGRIHIHFSSFVEPAILRRGSSSEITNERNGASEFSAHPSGSGRTDNAKRFGSQVPCYLNRRLLGESWSTAVQPISIIPLSISALISSRALSTPA